ncbi:hypothetical protein [Halomonas nitroreducens]|uniref:Uncharacterized protein n=1 Tax=Halomonas nitroreducens TaxID=447425 RepID=A0A3S0KTA4_9GAMM|nr:hypothetical protein [Halomonas nitroreducens]RTR06503.1 hypothetical protein EKG36_03240 [Halomonas nitroreducens]
MPPYVSPSKGQQGPTPNSPHLAESSGKATELLASLGDADLVRPELRNEAILAAIRSARDTADQEAGTARQQRKAPIGSRKD